MRKKKEMSLIFPEFNSIKKISQIQYSIGLDLSTVSTGMVLYDFGSNKVLENCALRFKSEDKDKIYEMGNLIAHKFEEWQDKHDIVIEELIFAKEKQPVQYGMKTTIATLVAIAKLHGLVEKYAYDNQIMMEDVAVPTIRKAVLGKAGAEKDEMFNYINEKYPECDLINKAGGKDIADALAVCLASKQGVTKDYEEIIKELNKSKKQYKTEKKRAAIEAEIQKTKEIIS